MNIVTGYKGEPHITSQQKRNINIGIFGSGAHIIKGVGAELSATVISANEVEIADGMIMCEGCASEIAHGTTESMTINNGTQGKLRIDLIVARYNRNTSTGVEDMTLIVIKGTPSASDPQSPAYISGNISDGDTTVDFPLYQVNIDGISITSVDALVSTVSVLDAITALQNKVDNTKLTVVNAPLGTLPFNNSGAAGGTIDVSQYIPSGYTMIGAIPATSGYFGCYFYTCHASSATTVLAQLLRISGTQTYTSPIVKLLCTKNL